MADRWTVLEPMPTCGSTVRCDNAEEGTAAIYVCTLHPDHHQDHEDDHGNSWHLTYHRPPGGEVVEGVAFHPWHGGGRPGR